MLQCIIIEKQCHQRAHDSQIVIAKENLKLNRGGLSYSQALGTNLPIKALRQSRHYTVKLTKNATSTLSAKHNMLLALLRYQHKTLQV